MDSVKQSMAQMSEMFNKTMMEFQQNLDKHTTTSSLASPPTRLASDFTSFRTFVLSSLQCLQTQIDALAALYENQEMRSRRKILLLHGIPEAKDENVANSLLDILSKRMKLDGLSMQSVSRCHRMGISRDNKPRPIMLKLRDLSTKDQIWAKKTSLKGTGITLSEFLTKSRHEIFLAAREHFGVTKCWTRDGRIYAIGADGVRHILNSVADVKSNITYVSATVNAGPGPSALPSNAQKDVKCALRSRKPARAK